MESPEMGQVWQKCIQHSKTELFQKLIMRSMVDVLQLAQLQIWFRERYKGSKCIQKHLKLGGSLLQSWSTCQETFEGQYPSNTQQWSMLSEISVFTATRSSPLRCRRWYCDNDDQATGRGSPLRWRLCDNDEEGPPPLEGQNRAMYGHSIDDISV